MRAFYFILLVCFVSTNLPAQKKSSAVNKTKLFTNDTILEATLSTDMGKLISERLKSLSLPATFTCKLSDSIVSEEIKIQTRGKFRKEYCYLPPLKLNFHNPTSPKLYKLNSLKLVCACKTTEDYDQLLLKEYIIYKMYNLLTEKSFRVRLLNLNYEDSRGKKKTVTQHAFLIEDIDDLAKRNNCKEWKGTNLHAEATDRNQMTMVGVFQYMIGNTDWGVSVKHNATLIYSRDDSTARPCVIPYDFDYSGLVNADYAVPNDQLGIENVRERLYRGFPRSMDELNEVFQIFKQQKENIYATINNFQLLTSRNRDDMIGYLDEFYKTINDQFEIKSVFIEGGRRQ